MSICRLAALNVAKSLNGRLKMPAISFSTMKDKIISGVKKQTIRPKRSDYWLKWEEGDRLVGYWKMRASGESEKLFEGEFRQNPFIITPKDDKWNGTLAVRDGFEGGENPIHNIKGQVAGQRYTPPKIKMDRWFEDKYGKGYIDMEFVVIKWRNNGNT